jgi:hypothetical protein
MKRAPTKRAVTEEIGKKSKTEVRGRRNCWRGARSVSPDINPHLRVFVTTSMRRSKIGLSLKVFAFTSISEGFRKYFLRELDGELIRKFIFA